MTTMQARMLTDHDRCHPYDHDRSLPLDHPGNTRMFGVAPDGLLGCTACPERLFHCRRDNSWHHVDRNAECELFESWGIACQTHGPVSFTGCRTRITDRGTACNTYTLGCGCAVDICASAEDCRYVIRMSLPVKIAGAVVGWREYDQCVYCGARRPRATGRPDLKIV